jgi:cysteine-rich repeat protein
MTMGVARPLRHLRRMLRPMGDWLAVALLLTLGGCALSHQLGDAPPACGDGLVQEGERCDDGGEEGGTCSSDCQVVLPPPCAGEWRVLDSAARHWRTATGEESSCDRLTDPPPSPTGFVGELRPDDYAGLGWYRFEGAAGTGMPIEPVPDGRCGGDAPGWLTEPPPPMEAGVVERGVCFSFFERCRYESTIRVAHCDEFILYELAPAPQCDLRYCGDDIDVAAYR